MTHFCFLTSFDFNEVITGGRDLPHFEAGSVLQMPCMSKNWNLNRKMQLEKQELHISIERVIASQTGHDCNIFFIFTLNIL